MVSHPTIPTVAGQPTRGETYAKLLHHLQESQSLAAVMAHLHQTEHENIKDVALARGWLIIAELLRKFTDQVTTLAMGKLIQ